MKPREAFRSTLPPKPLDPHAADILVADSRAADKAAVGDVLAPDNPAAEVLAYAADARNLVVAPRSQAAYNQRAAADIAVKISGAALG